jgi:hypothetical protein
LSALVESRLPQRWQETGVTQSDQLVLDRARELSAPPLRREPDTGERAARDTLRSQLARLERELGSIVADRFPYISAAVPDWDFPAARGGELRGPAGPSLLSLQELERTRDRLAGRVQELRRLAAEREEHERSAHEQLRRMKLEPGRYKFVRLPVSDLGQGGCGVWHVRPRLGLIGMLAGWWQVKLSSGCPLPRGSRSTRDPDEPS